MKVRMKQMLNRSPNTVLGKETLRGKGEKEVLCLRMRTLGFNCGRLKGVEGLPWQSSNQDSPHSLLWTQVQFLVRELLSPKLPGLVKKILAMRTHKKVLGMAQQPQEVAFLGVQLAPLQVSITTQHPQPRPLSSICILSAFTPIYIFLFLYLQKKDSYL